MSCSKHFLGLNWNHHNWERQVTRTGWLEGRVTDMWGRACDVRNVHCHTQYVCSDCGDVVDGGECTCEAQRGERCPARLEFLASHTGSTADTR